ncbi:fibronectin type III domain-containing protein [Roseivirga sp. BDSF3-8]|uniref:fibronectin type III domain-containing protein n=1 Tax=Roseivirga sp. BDSF3-8 TaxID=3241598 RepID=UPI0035323952
MMKGRPVLRLWTKVWVCMVLCLLGVFGQAAAQSAVQASLQIFPPNSVYLSHYGQPGSLQVQLLLRDLSEASYPIQLRWTIEGPGIRLSTRQGYQGNIITLQGGMPRLLSAPELASGLSADALDFSGYDRGQFTQSGGQLPEGFYRFTVQAYDFRRPDVPLSAPATTTAWLVLADPPLLNLPACHSQLTWQTGQPLLFQWTPMHRGSGLSGIAYEFTLVEVRGGLPPDEAMRTLSPLYQTVTRQTSLTYGLELPPLQEGLTYAWRVRAQVNESGPQLTGSPEETFKNQGYSRVCAFVPGTPVADLPPLSDLTAEALSHVHARFSFAGYHRDNRRRQATTYRLQYRPTHQSDWPWRSVDITDTVYIARELAPGTPYEVKAGVVRNGIASQWSQVTPFTTQAPPEQACYDDEGPLPEITNREPLPNALVGDQIAVGKFTMRLQEVRGGDGVFSGRGTIYVPWMGLTLPVQFDRIAINTDYRMTDGLVHALSKPLDEWREGIEEFWEDRQQLADTTITVSGYLEAVTLKEPAEGNSEATTDSRTYVVTLASGETLEIQQPPGQSVAVIDSQGRTIVIDEEGRIGPILEPEADTPVLATGDRISQPVYFTAYEGQRYGFDTQLHEVYSAHYESLPVTNRSEGTDTYPIAWKALATGQTDRVTLQGDTTGLKLLTQSGQHVPILEKTDDEHYTLLLTGQGDKEESYLQAIRTNAEDSTDVLSGQLNTVSYAPEHLTLKVVPVNGAGYMKPGRGKDILKALKETYGPAVVNWTVTYEKAFTADYDTDGDGALDDGSTGMLSNYTPEMKKLIRRYEQAHKTADGTYYLFLVHTPKSAIDEDGTDNAKAGFMPYKRQFGFIFTSRIGNPDHFDKTIAHELGHGAFRLQHTFVETPALEEWATKNLMDYTFFGTELHKHQWDLIHNPRPVWGLLTGDEEVAMTTDDEKYQKILQEIRCAYLIGETTYSSDMLGKLDNDRSYLDEEEVEVGAVVIKDIDMYYTGRSLSTELPTSIEPTYVETTLSGYYQHKLGDLYINTAERSPELLEYLKPAESEVKGQLREVMAGIDLDGQDISGRSFDQLWAIANCETRFLSKEDRIKLVRLIMIEEPVLNENYENLILDILHTTPEHDAAYVYREITKNEGNLLNKLMNGIDNIGGEEDNYDRLGTEVYRLFLNGYDKLVTRQDITDSLTMPATVDGAICPYIASVERKGNFSFTITGQHKTGISRQGHGAYIDRGQMGGVQATYYYRLRVCGRP